MDAFDFNFTHSIGLFASTCKTGEVLESRDFLVSTHRGKVAEFNQGILKQPSYKLARTLERIRAYYTEAKVPFRLHVPTCDEAVCQALAEHGFTRVDDLPMMVIAQPGFVPDVPELSVRPVRDAQTLADFQRVAFESFGYPAERAPIVLTEQLVQLPHVEIFVGYVDGAAACCAMLLVTGGVAGIYWVGALDAHRRRGLGGAITAHAVAAGRERGCRQACLQASPMGAPVYRRLGFAHPRSYLRFDHPGFG